MLSPALIGADREHRQDQSAPHDHREVQLVIPETVTQDV